MELQSTITCSFINDSSSNDSLHGRIASYHNTNLIYIYHLKAIPIIEHIELSSQFI